MECKETAAEILSNLNENVDPCHDFYQYSCGGRDMKIMSLSKLEALRNQRENSNLHADDKLRNHGSKAIREAKKVYDDCINRNETNCNNKARWVCENAFFRVYIDKYFSVAEHKAATRLISSLRSTFVEDIVNKIKWIDPETKKHVLKNLTELQLNVGYPDWLLDDTILDYECEHVKPNPWPINPLTVNAEFDQQGNRGRISKYFSSVS